MISRDLRAAAALVSVTVLALALWQVSFVLLLVFFAVLIAVGLRHPAQALAGWTGMPVNLALALVVLLIVAALGGFAMMQGMRILTQFEELWTRIPEAVTGLEERLRDSRMGGMLVRRMEGSGEGGGMNVMGAIGGTLVTLGGAGANIVVVLTLSIFLATKPEFYRRGMVKLVPPQHRPRADQICHDIGRGLWYWLLGQLVDMLAVAALVFLGLWLLGVPLPLTLALIAGLLNFVPFVGPIISVVPAILVALSEGMGTVVWVGLLYLTVQQIEGNVIMPLVQQRTTAIPPALTIVAVALFGVLFGLIGVLLATPLLLVAMILVQKLWVEDTLGDREDAQPED
ncbi:AI-2E family transporter [Pseudoroseicyclus aestuarii]|uniref:Putative PurR-regulated permease PerM n=1 Tax=Pseudoroseicyclus aestuarii TaxID=1795041 RepID=A0A318SU60_9RHOB|nr:AI-2E family transporter [Pseudoroseicyclus aestuarii]PYE84895.1 putative PurR-regulated permease PerM [Pseudoroseicyclus aestuarii]